MPGKNKDNKRSKSKSERNSSRTDLPDTKTNSSTNRSAEHPEIKRSFENGE